MSFPKMLTNNFFDRDAATVAKDLLGKVLRVKHQDVWLSAMIIETEAYYLREKGSHSSLGFTQKRRALFMPAGTIYMYHSRAGDSLNTSCHGPGNAVLIKAGIPYINVDTPPEMLPMMQQLNPSKNGKPRNNTKLCSGQALLCKSLGLKIKNWDQKNYDPEKFYIEDVSYHPQKIIQTTRLGITPGRDEHLMLRFVDFDYAAYCSSNPLTKKAWQAGREYKIINLNPKPLKDLHVLVTRPKLQAQLLCQMIRAEGGKAILFPTLAIADPVDQSHLLNAIKNLARFDFALFTSTNAVLKTMPLWQRTPKNLLIGAMGPTTAQALLKHHLKVALLPKSPFNSEMFLELPQLQNIHGKHIVIFTGEGGRNYLAKILQQRGAEITSVPVYRRIQPHMEKSRQKWQLQDIDIITCNSYEGLENLLLMLKNKKEQILKKPLLVSGERLLLLAKKLGFSQVVSAANATDEAVLNTLKAWYS